MNAILARVLLSALSDDEIEEVAAPLRASGPRPRGGGGACSLHPRTCARSLFVPRPRDPPKPRIAVCDECTKWNFCEHADGRWSWHRIHPCMTCTSSVSFATLDAALADAERSGFRNGRSRIGQIIRADGQPRVRSRSLTQ